MTRQPGTPVRVIQVGPKPGTPGGMASVIEEIVASTDPGAAELRVIGTFGDTTGVFSLPGAFKSAASLMIHRRSWDVAHVHLSEYGSFIREGMFVWLASLLGKGAVVSLHGARFHDQVTRHPHITRVVLSRADHVTCLGVHHLALVRKVAPNVPSSIVLNPIADASIARRRKTDRDATVPKFLFVGEVGLRKGFDLLMEAWPHVRGTLPEATLTVAGPLVEGFTPPFGAGVDYVGVISRDAVRSLLGDVDVSVLPSRAEVLPMSVLEALAEGVPTVYSKAGEWETFRDCPAVIIVEADPSDASFSGDLASAMIAAARLPNRTAASAAAIDWSRSHSASSTICRQIVDIYRRVSPCINDVIEKDRT